MGTDPHRKPFELSLLGVPSSAGSYAAGQERAPRALREAGLIRALLDAGIGVIDRGDLPEQIWAPDSAAPRAQNAAAVVESVTALAGRVHDELERQRRVLVVGGNCTVATGAVAGLQRHLRTPCGIVYVDRHFDMNTPETTREGALDWMGLGHALDLPGALTEYAAAFDTRPLLGPGRVAFLGVDPSQATDFEREHVARLGLDVTTQSEVIDDPVRAAHSALAALQDDDPFVLHVDVDVLDFTDAPLAENTSGRNLGPSLAQLADALRVVVADSRWRVLTLGEINPTRAAGVPRMLPHLNETLAWILRSAA
ncbi:arginase family protein [Nocardia callitridis]